MLGNLLKFHLLISLLLRAGLAVANEPTASDPSALVLNHRDISQFELSDIVLVSTLDGSLQARLRDSGQELWTLPNQPLVDMQRTDGASDHESTVTWIAEPSVLGGLYYFTSEGGIEKIPASVWDLVEKSPFGMVENVVYTGSRHSTLYALDIKTGEVIQAFGETLELSRPKNEVDPTGVLMIGRTEYTLDIHESLGSPGYRIRIGVWAPNSRDQDLAGQYSRPLDSVYLTPINNNTIVALAENDMRPQRWIGQTSSILINVYDVLKSKTDGYLSLVQQPPLRLPGLEAEWGLYVTNASNTSLAVLSGPRYAALVGTASKADYCTGSGDGQSILGVHPLWCQEKRRATNTAPPAISLLPHPSSSAYPNYPRLDPPNGIVKSIEDGKSGWRLNWPLIIRLLENAGIIALLLAMFVLCAYKGWLPVDLLAALQVLLGRAKQIRSEQQQQQQQLQHQQHEDPKQVPRQASQDQKEGTTPTSESSDEPKKRKRGARGGRRNGAAAGKKGSAGGADRDLDEKSEHSSAERSPASDREGQLSKNKEFSRDGEIDREPSKEKGREGTRESALAGSPISLTDTVLGYGSHGTTVFKGRYEGRDVAVKRMLLEFYDVASREVDILRESDDHPNVVRYYCKYETEQFLYIALELCPGTLEDVVRGSSQLSTGFEPLCALRQIAEGLQHLHSLQIVHRDIKPQNILVAVPMAKVKNRKALTRSVSVRYLISDFGLCRKLEGEQSSFLPTFADSAAGTAGWAAPEISLRNTKDPKDQTRLTRAVDIFSMGCLFYYVMSGGSHPFGDAHMRQVNIQQGRPPELHPGPGVTPEALDLIPRMLSHNPNLRPSIDQILLHPLFWTDQLKLDFLLKVSDRLEHDTRLERSDLIDRLERHALEVVGSDWHTRFPAVFIENLGKYRRYHGDRIVDLLRALRNKRHHYNDFSEELKECVGQLPSGYLQFFTARFPALLIRVYYFALSEFSTEDEFHVYFRGS